MARPAGSQTGNNGTALGVNDCPLDGAQLVPPHLVPHPRSPWDGHLQVHVFKEVHAQLLLLRRVLLCRLHPPSRAAGGGGGVGGVCRPRGDAVQAVGTSCAGVISFLLFITGQNDCGGRRRSLVKQCPVLVVKPTAPGLAGLTGVVELSLLGCCPLLGRVPAPAAARRSSQQSSPPVSQWREASTALCNPQSCAHCRAWFVEALGAVGSRGGLGADRGARGGGGERGLLAGQQRGAKLAARTPAALLSGLVALCTISVEGRGLDRLQAEDMKEQKKSAF